MKFLKSKINKREREIAKIFGAAYAVTIIVISGTNWFFHIDTLNPPPEADVRNWVSLVVALIIPTAIAVAIWKDSKYDQEELGRIVKDVAEQQKTISNLVTEVKSTTSKVDNIIEKQETEKAKRYQNVVNRIHSSLMNIQGMIMAVDRILKDAVVRATSAEIKNHLDLKDYFIHDLERTLLQNPGMIPDELLAKINCILDNSKHHPKYTNEYNVDMTHCSELIEDLVKIRKELPEIQK